MDTLSIRGGEDLLDRFRHSCFGQFTDWRPKQKCSLALHQVVSRVIESDDGLLWFYICGQRVCFTPADFALITGLPFGASTFDTTQEYDISGVAAYRAFCDPSRATDIVQLISRVTDLENRVDDVDGSLHLRAVLVCVAHCMICGADKHVESWMWALVDDLDAFCRFPWGAYAYKVMKHYTEHCGTGKKYSYYGPAWAVYVWALEKVPGIAAHVGIRVPDKENANPRILRWGFNHMPSGRTSLSAFFEATEV